jgi:hypothetical protein
MSQVSMESHDNELLEFCGIVAQICVSDEFKRLFREIFRHYRKSGMENPKLQAYQDVLFAMVHQTEQEDSIRLKMM